MIVPLSYGLGGDITILHDMDYSQAHTNLVIVRITSFVVLETFGLALGYNMLHEMDTNEP